MTKIDDDDDDDDDVYDDDHHNRPHWESEYGVLAQGALAKIEICYNECILRSHGAHTLSKYEK